MTRKSFWRTPWNSEQEYYIDALHDGRRIIVVFSDVDVWHSESLHIDVPPSFVKKPQGEIYCCGQTRTVRGYPCGTCGSHYCPSCGHCRCQRLELQETVCQRCYMRYLPHLIVDGLCSECRS